MIRRMVRLGLTLMLVGLVAACCLGLTYAVTKDRIEEQKRKEEAEACIDAMPGIESAEELEEDVELEKRIHEHIKDVEKVFKCDLGDVIIMKAKGYGGPIRMAVGIGNDGKVKGISVISHNETPGLGSNVENEQFQDEFKGMSVENDIRVEKDGGEIKAITGATITSRAACKEVREALQAFEEIKSSQ